MADKLIWIIFTSLYILLINSDSSLAKIKLVSEFFQPEIQFKGNTDNVMLGKRESLHTFKNVLSRRNIVAHKNLRNSNQILKLNDGEVPIFKPGDTALPFHIWALNGSGTVELLEYPRSLSSPLIIHFVDAVNSGFLECIWESNEALTPLLNDNETQYLFIPTIGLNPVSKYSPDWIYRRLQNLTNFYMRSAEVVQRKMKQFHISVLPLYELGNWLPSLLRAWECVDHNCGYDQVLINTNSTTQRFPFVSKRLDAHYDWLPSPISVFGNRSVPVASPEADNIDGCKTTTRVKGKIALLGGIMGQKPKCSYFQKVKAMNESGAVGVIFTTHNTPLQDLNCVGEECLTPLPIPATIIHNSPSLDPGSMMSVTFQNTPSPNFFAAIDEEGLLQETGWFLYPTMKFLNWQTQWFKYKQKLTEKLQRPAKVIQVFKERVMQGVDGVVANISVAGIKDYQHLELDLSLSCPGDRDTTCAHWDHGISLSVCCDHKSDLCGMEMGRWISPFRRRIGRWLTNVSSLLPLLYNSQSEQCTFTMKTAAWALPWIPSLNLRLYKTEDIIYPSQIFVLFEPGATFDKNYNSHFKPYRFQAPSDVKKVEIFAVITGHGSDENGCGEFCVTSHHFEVNGQDNNITFSNAGTPEGCADQVLTGVEPNEHGTWLYGRNGWCDGRNVFPWVLDVTHQIELGQSNEIRYFGYFNGTDPNPLSNAGSISIYSYLVYYREKD